MPRLRAPRGSYAVGVARRQRIIEAAAEEFARGGFYNTTLTRIAHAAGLTDAGVAHHFRSKQDLLLAVVEWRQVNALEWWGRYRGAPVPVLFAAVPRAIARDLTHPGLIELFVTLAAEASAPDHPAHGFFVERYRVTVDRVRDVLAAGRACGEVRAGTDPDDLARELVALRDGLQLQWLLSGRRLDLVAAVRSGVDRMAAAVLTPAALARYRPDDEG